MAVLTIRNVPEEVQEWLRLRAAHRGTSMEAEARTLLEQASRESQHRPSARALQGWVQELYGDDRPDGVVDELLKERRKQAQKEAD